MDIDQEEFDDLINKVNANKVWNGFLKKKIEFENKMFDFQLFMTSHVKDRAHLFCREI